MCLWVLLPLLAASTTVEASQGYAGDFEASVQGWSPRASTVAVERVEGVGATPESKASLRVRGTMEANWNYALSPSFPLKPEALYQLSAWVRVDSLGPTTPPPYLKCEFVGSDGRTSLGRASTDPYDTQRLRTWQHLIGEFRAPKGVATGWLALEKGMEQPTAIDAYLDDVRVMPISQLHRWEKYRLSPLPPALEARRRAHPRLYLDGDRVAQLRRSVQTTHASLWQAVKAQADRAVAAGPPPYRERDDQSGDEQLWQREVGNTMPLLAMAYLVTGEKAYLDAARAWALASCSYPTWGLGATDGKDLAAGHQLFGLGLVYDWCYDGLDEEARATIRQTLLRRGSAMFEAAASGEVWWHRAYLQNHLWVNATGLAVAGLALFDEEEEAGLWVGLALDKFQHTMEALGPDGASHEGVGYWGYGVEYMLKFMVLARELLGVDLFDRDWWQHTASYRLCLSLPQKSWTRQNNVVDIADCPRSNWYGPDYLLRELAREYRDETAQWLAQAVDEAHVEGAEAAWLNLLWFDPAVKATAPTGLPTLHHFTDMGIVSARSDWSGEESLVVLKCGAFIGETALRSFTYDPGGGHVHPDANHFLLFGCGQWLLRDDGYRPKFTDQHNTLLVDGKGQLGEGQMWFASAEPLALKACPRVIRAASTARMDHVVGDAREAYPARSGLTRYVRHLLFLKPDVLIVADDVATDGPRALELRFHPEERASAGPDGSYLARGRSALLRIEPLTTEGVEVLAGDTPARARGETGGTDTMFAIRLLRKDSAWRNAVALSWSSAAAEPVRVTLRREGDRWTFVAGERSATVDWATGEAQSSP
jgi:hypothetical protein